MAGRVFVAGPDYQPVGVLAEVVPAALDGAGATVEAVIAATQLFLHPLTAGPGAPAWGFGRAVYASDLAG